MKVGDIAYIWDRYPKTAVEPAALAAAAASSSAAGLTAAVVDGASTASAPARQVEVLAASAPHIATPARESCVPEIVARINQGDMPNIYTRRDALVALYAKMKDMIVPRGVAPAGDDAAAQVAMTPKWLETNTKNITRVTLGVVADMAWRGVDLQLCYNLLNELNSSTPKCIPLDSEDDITDEGKYQGIVKPLRGEEAHPKVLSVSEISNLIEALEVAKCYANGLGRKGVKRIVALLEAEINHALDAEMGVVEDYRDDKNRTLFPEKDNTVINQFKAALMLRAFKVGSGVENIGDANCKTLLDALNGYYYSESNIQTVTRSISVVCGKLLEKYRSDERQGKFELELKPVLELVDLAPVRGFIRGLEGALIPNSDQMEHVQRLKTAMAIESPKMLAELATRRQIEAYRSKNIMSYKMQWLLKTVTLGTFGAPAVAGAAAGTFFGVAAVKTFVAGLVGTSVTTAIGTGGVGAAFIAAAAVAGYLVGAAVCGVGFGIYYGVKYYRAREKRVYIAGVTDRYQGSCDTQAVNAYAADVARMQAAAAAKKGSRKGKEAAAERPAQVAVVAGLEDGAPVPTKKGWRPHRPSWLHWPTFRKKTDAPKVAEEVSADRPAVERQPSSEAPKGPSAISRWWDSWDRHDVKNFFTSCFRSKVVQQVGGTPDQL